jgi:DNA-binding transcriptional ArsR family regulator
MKLPVASGAALKLASSNVTGEVCRKNATYRSGLRKARSLTIIFNIVNLEIMNVNLLQLAPKAAEAESFLKALANRHRLMVLCQLHGGELSVTKLQEAIGLSQSSLSQHLARLREDKLVKTRRESQTIYYSLADANVSRIIGLLYEMFCAEQCGRPVKPRARAKSRELRP